MVGVILPEAIAGLLLVFFLPGYTLTKATFPEWRVRGRVAFLRLLEFVTLALVLSVVLTVLVGYVLLTAAPGGFQAFWTDPVLEAVLAGTTVLGFVAGWMRGAYRREAPPAPARESAGGDEGAWELSRELDSLGRDERRVAHELRTRAGDPAQEARLREELDRIRVRREQLREHREAEYAA
jgi:Protein of unknown function (DUF1616)